MLDYGGGVYCVFNPACASFQIFFFLYAFVLDVSSHLADMSFFLSLCSYRNVQEYVTVNQLNQMYGMPKVELSPTSPFHQPNQSAAVNPAFSCLLSPHGSSHSLSVKVCLSSLLLL